MRRCVPGGGQLPAQLRAELRQYVGRPYPADAAAHFPAGSARRVGRHVHRAVLPRGAVFVLPVAEILAAQGPAGAGTTITEAPLDALHRGELWVALQQWERGSQSQGLRRQEQRERAGTGETVFESVRIVLENQGAFSVRAK